jgi:hypothetical protein
MLLEQSVERRDKKRAADLMRTFFKDESTSRVLVDSTAEMVWLSDCRTSHECTYAISINREKKEVLLAFCGMEVKLLNVRKGIFNLFGQPKPRVKYQDETTFIRSWLRQK